MYVSVQTGTLVDKRGKIMVPGMYNDVAPLTEEETGLYEKIDFDMEEYCKDVGVGKLLHATKARSQNWFPLFTGRQKYVALSWNDAMVISHKINAIVLLLCL